MLSTTTLVPPRRVDDVGYSCDDYKRLQHECRELKRSQERSRASQRDPGPMSHAM